MKQINDYIYLIENEAEKNLKRLNFELLDLYIFLNKYFMLYKKGINQEEWKYLFITGNKN